MSKYIHFYRKSGHPLEISISNVSDWEGFEKLIFFTQKYYHAKIISQSDGPDVRRWILECKGHQFELIHQDHYGNYFLAPGSDSEEIICEIANDIEQRFINSEK